MVEGLSGLETTKSPTRVNKRNVKQSKGVKRGEGEWRAVVLLHNGSKSCEAERRETWQKEKPVHDHDGDKKRDEA